MFLAIELTLVNLYVVSARYRCGCKSSMSSSSSLRAGNFFVVCEILSFRGIYLNFKYHDIYIY